MFGGKVKGAGCGEVLGHLGRARMLTVSARGAPLVSAASSLRQMQRCGDSLGCRSVAISSTHILRNTLAPWAQRLCKLSGTAWP